MVKDLYTKSLKLNLNSFLTPAINLKKTCPDFIGADWKR
jgi:hypothetical protein